MNAPLRVFPLRSWHDAHLALADALLAVADGSPQARMHLAGLSNAELDAAIATLARTLAVVEATRAGRP